MASQRNVPEGKIHFIFDPSKPWSEQTPQDLPPLNSEGERFGLLLADWSPDGKYLAGGKELAADGNFSGIVIYSFESQQYRRLTDLGIAPQWLNDSRRLLFRQKPSQISLMDSQTTEKHEVFSVDSGGLHFCLSEDNRTIFFVHWKTEADIWMLTLNEERE